MPELAIPLPWGTPPKAIERPYRAALHHPRPHHNRPCDTSKEEGHALRDLGVACHTERYPTGARHAEDAESHA